MGSSIFAGRRLSPRSYTCVCVRVAGSLAGWVMGTPPWHLSCLPRTRVDVHQPRTSRIPGVSRNLARFALPPVNIYPWGGP